MTKPGAWRPLEGKRILDFGWVVSAPLVGLLTAGLGAEVIKIESKGRADNLRLRGAVRKGFGVDWNVADNAPTFHAINQGKRSFGVDLKSDEGLQLVRDLIATSDAIIENYTVGTLERMGLGDDVLRSVNPRLVRLSLTPAGRTGPLAGLRSYAATTGALAGLEASVGYPDEPTPVGMLTFGVADYFAGAMAAFALVAALRDRPGREFTSIDASQMAANTIGLGAGFAAHAAGLATRPGNTHPLHAPHGIYEAATGGHLAVAVLSDEEWSRLSALLGVADETLADRADRVERRAEVDELVARWCARRGRDDAVSALVGARIRAAPVISMAERDDHPYHRARVAVHSLDMPNGEQVAVPSLPWRTGSAPAVGVRDRGPCLGEDTVYVCRTILGMSETAVVDLAARGIVDLPSEVGT